MRRRGPLDTTVGPFIFSVKGSAVPKMFVNGNNWTQNKMDCCMDELSWTNNPADCKTSCVSANRINWPVEGGSPGGHE